VCVSKRSRWGNHSSAGPPRISLVTNLGYAQESGPIQALKKKLKTHVLCECEGQSSNGKSLLRDCRDQVESCKLTCYLFKTKLILTYKGLNKESVCSRSEKYMRFSHIMSLVIKQEPINIISMSLRSHYRFALTALLHSDELNE
jgi:hypothetical protein